ncbi:MAG: G5 domain-containing protein [Clostridiales bacterium]|nr:G5 domain-containing protein [Clostridiales bacterium]
MGASPDGPARFLKTRHILVALFAAALVVVSVTGFVWADKGVTLVVDGETRHLTTNVERVSDLLAEVGVGVDPADVVSPSASTPLVDGMTIVVRHATSVTVDLSGGAIELDVVGTNVTDALIAAGIDPTSGISVDPSLETPLAEDMRITVTDVFVRVVEEYVDVEYEVVTENDAALPQGARAIKNHGEPGKAVKVYRVVVTDGVEGPRSLVAERIVSEPVDEVVLLGTKRSAGRIVAARAGASVTPPRGGTKLTVVATGYTPGDPGVDDWTATGARAIRGVIAVDPSVIPLGTRVYVPGYGYAVAADTGGAIKGNKIDLCFDTRTEALNWGRRTVTIIILP